MVSGKSVSNNYCLFYTLCVVTRMEKVRYLDTSAELWLINAVRKTSVELMDNVPHHIECTIWMR